MGAISKLDLVATISHSLPEGVEIRASFSSSFSGQTRSSLGQFAEILSEQLEKEHPALDWRDERERCEQKILDVN